MELIRVSDSQYYTCQWFGNDRNGNAIYLVNIFQEYQQGNILNITECGGRNTDKHGNLRIKAYKNSIRDIVASILAQKE